MKLLKVRIRGMDDHDSHQNLASTREMSGRHSIIRHGSGGRCIFGGGKAQQPAATRRRRTESMTQSSLTILNRWR